MEKLIHIMDLPMGGKVASIGSKLLSRVLINKLQTAVPVLELPSTVMQFICIAQYIFASSLS